MDLKDKNDGELDLQALLDKYLPEEESEEPQREFVVKETPLNEEAAQDTAASMETAKTFKVTGTKKDKKKASQAESEPESVEVSFEKIEASEDTVKEEESAKKAQVSSRIKAFRAKPKEENNDFFIGSGLPEDDFSASASDKNTASPEKATPVFEEQGAEDMTDDNFFIDEESLARILSDDEIQFGGIEGFENIEDLSGYTEEVPVQVPVVDEKINEEAGAELSYDESYSVDTGADFADEDEYAEFVHASLDELDSEEATDTDINLIVAFGLEDELKEQVGEKKASKITKSYDLELEQITEKEKKTLHDEYRSPSQTKEISERYKKSYVALKIKLAIAVCLALVLMFFENIPLIGYQMAGAFDPAVYPVIYVMVDLQILLLCLAMAYEEIFAGFATLLRGKPSPESVLSVTSLVSVVMSVYVAATAVPPVEPTLFNLPVAFLAVMTLLYSYMTLKREIFSFNVISSKKPKYALRRLSAKDASLEVAALSANADEIGDVLKIEKVSFIDGYFYRTESKIGSNSAVIFMSLLLSIALSALIGGYSSMMGYELPRVLSLGFIALTATLPVAVNLTYAYPFYKANSESYENDSTIVGENSLEEYSGAAVISFEDNLVFPSMGVKVQNIKVYNNYRFDRVLYYAASVFTKTGGPLSDVFEIATLEMGYSDDVVLTGVGEGYIQADVGGKAIAFGRAEALSQLGINMPAEITNEDEDTDPSLSIMYMIFKGKVVAKMHIAYNLDADFEYIVKQLADSGMYACVKTFDPNVDEEMIRSKLQNIKYPMRVIRYSSFDEIAVEYENSDSGVVARGSSKALLQTVTYCDKVLDVKRTNSFITLIATIISAVVVAAVILTDSVSAIRSLMVVGLQFFWMIPMLISTKMTLR